jgi:hypothetical protein
MVEQSAYAVTDSHCVLQQFERAPAHVGRKWPTALWWSIYRRFAASQEQSSA